MDDTDRAVREETDRRLAVLEVEEREAPRPAFPHSDMVALPALVVGLAEGMLAMPIGNAIGVALIAPGAAAGR